MDENDAGRQAGTGWGDDLILSLPGGSAKPGLKWLADKEVDVRAVHEELRESAARNQYSNSGPCSRNLERHVAQLLEIDADRRSVIVTCNGTAALHALVAAFDLHREEVRGLRRAARWATQAFTFPTSCQGPLSGRCQIVDIDEGGGIDLSLVDSSRERVEGVIVTNVLGNVVDIDRYVRWGDERGAIVVFDNAATACSDYRGRNALNYGHGSIISFHHTKPFGFGEGGAIVVLKEYEPFVRRVINFGYDMTTLTQRWHHTASNYKMSDPSAAFVLAYLKRSSRAVIARHRAQYAMWRDLMAGSASLGIRLFPTHGEGGLVPSCIAVLMPRPVQVADFPALPVRKYYKPISDDRLTCPVSADYYDRIMCFPCNVDVTEGDIQWMHALIVDWVLGQAPTGEIVTNT